MNTKVISKKFQTERALRRHDRITYLLYAGIALAMFLIIFGIYQLFVLSFLGLALFFLVGGTWVNLCVTNEGKSNRRQLLAEFEQAEIAYNELMHKEYKIYETLIIAEMDRIANGSKPTER